MVEVLQNVDYTPIIQAIFGLIIALLGSFWTLKISPMLKQKFSEKQIAIIINVVQRLVEAAEQVYDSAEGKKKKEYVLELAQKELIARGIKIDVDVLSGYIEAAVYQLKQWISAK